MDPEAQQALQQAAALADAETTSPISSQSPSHAAPRFELDTQWDTTPARPDATDQHDAHAHSHLPYPEFPTAASTSDFQQAIHDAHQVADHDASPEVSSPDGLGVTHGRIPGTQKYTSMAPPPTRIAGAPPDNIIEWRHKFFNISQNALTLPKQQWDELWIWIDNIWTPRRVPYTKKDGTVHYEWRCRYHKKVPLPSQSTGKRKREIRKGYGCPARMTANLMPSTRIFTVDGFELHNHPLEDLDSTKICSGVRKWTAMHVQMGLPPKQIEALINGKDNPDGSGVREALDMAGGKLLDEKTIRNVARKWRWPAAKFGMRQDELFRELHSQHNTFPFAIQEPESFHRDVCEVSNVAETAEDLHRLLDERKEMRLRELDQRFDGAATYLTHDPSQAGHQHWDHVLQLFKDRSYDALVRYFAAFVPEEAQQQDEFLRGIEAPQPPTMGS
ncbi:uncharacterized protein BCR38DRAFT_430868 [Pseudomassariella vexata]|uniref:Uncharacterized protein n=1 Tax=Pseudomassariella vexata TaxID=1141098 RepID=A0A1Y2E526_9PEZI|nr:uncharacterized protein BCR38DRAFT_430868 [Pseudomassariella vexata]ORY66622.1 hypothetical protein BCR38DRAFT_430868 [Pseudomassariella vexata]